ncbi:hypothetical protein Y888_02630 [Mixta calida B021323]|nr:hypothetical protein Y888_02630 [Mixta calida B021323]
MLKGARVVIQRWKKRLNSIFMIVRSAKCIVNSGIRGIVHKKIPAC